MITYVASDIFDSPAKVLVNTVNTVGVMGKGIAKVFKAVYPEMFKEYQALCETRQFDIGQLWLYKAPNRWVLNFPTKRHWRNPSKVEFLEQGLAKFANSFSDYGITSVAFPLLGCGNGGTGLGNPSPTNNGKISTKLAYTHIHTHNPYRPTA